MKKYILLFVALLTSIGAWANVKFITDVVVIGGSKSEVNTLKASLTAAGWTLIDQDLNAGAGGDYIYLLYKSDYVNSGYITDFYISNQRGTAPDNLTHDGRNYSLVAYEGGSRFGELKGDLNSRADGDYIHLYFTRDGFDDNRAVSGITFSNVKDGAVGKNGGTTGYDLNSGAGGDYIYMHVSTDRAGWTARDVANHICRITGYNGNQEEITELTVPTTINGSTAISFDDMDFSGFKNLETLNFYSDASVENMPSLKGLKKFKHVNIVHFSGSIFHWDELPASITTLEYRAFARTAIKTLVMPSVENVHDGSFEGCDSLEKVIFEKEAYIGEDAFANIHCDSCIVICVGSMDKWDYKRFHHSPNLVVRENFNSWFTGWCGDTIANNCLYWKMNALTEMNNEMYISCGGEEYYNNYPEAQVISNRPWNKTSPKYFDCLYLDRVYSIGEKEFQGLIYLKQVHVNATLDSIGPSAFDGCNSLSHLWFDGTKTEWNKVRKDSQWRSGAPNFTEHWRCTVTFNNNGYGTAPAPQSGLWRLTDKATEPRAPIAYRYDFTGWYTEPECENKWDFNNVIPDDMTLYAGWESSIYPLGDVDGSGVVDGNDLNILINILLGKDNQDNYAGRAEIDGFDGINGSDVNVLINILLGK